MAEGTKEKHLEDDVVKYLTKISQPEFPEYVLRDTSCYVKDLCLIPGNMFGLFNPAENQKEY